MMINNFVNFLNNNSGVTSFLSLCVVGLWIPYYFRKKERKQYDLNIMKNIFVESKPRTDDPIEISNRLTPGPVIRTNKRIWILNQSASSLHNVVAMIVDDEISDMDFKKLNFEEHIVYSGLIKNVTKTTVYGQKYAFRKSDTLDMTNKIVILLFEDDNGSFWGYNDGHFIKLKKFVDVNTKYGLHAEEMSTAESDVMNVNK